MRIKKSLNPELLNTNKWRNLRLSLRTRMTPLLIMIGLNRWTLRNIINYCSLNNKKSQLSKVQKHRGQVQIDLKKCCLNLTEKLAPQSLLRVSWLMIFNNLNSWINLLLKLAGERRLIDRGPLIHHQGLKLFQGMLQTSLTLILNLIEQLQDRCMLMQLSTLLIQLLPQVS